MSAPPFTPTHYLRVEGVNFDAFLYDTSDLSTIRGGSMALLRVGFNIETELEKHFGRDRMQRLQVGASSGLFGLRLEGTETPGFVRDSLSRWQQEDEVLRHATLVLDIVPAGKGFKRVLQELFALNRARQLQSPSLLVPAGAATNDGPCAYHRVRPAEKVIRVASEQALVCASVAARREHGRDLRQEFYEQEIEAPVSGDFTDSFEELSANPPPGCRHLTGKIALLYADANGMGGHFEHCAYDAERYRELAAWQLGQRRALLRLILKRMEGDRGWWTSGSPPCRRMEVLLWGGDEMICIVPAWRGWDFVSLLGEELARWRLPHPPHEPVFHASAALFASHKAPVHSLRRLARTLADEAKEKNRQANFVMAEVLETFDHVGPELDEYYRRRLPAWMSSRDLVLPFDKLAGFTQAIKRLKQSDLGRRQTHRLADEVAKTRTLEQAQQKVQEASAEWREIDKQALHALLKLCGGPQALLHMARLWEYIAPET